MNVAQRSSRALAFLRHIPPRQIARRFILILRRGTERHLKPALSGSPAKLRDDAPLPLFAPRQKSCERTSHGWSFTFLGRHLVCDDPIDWRLGGPGDANQLWRMNLHYFEWAEGLADRDFTPAVDQWIAAYPPFAPGADQDGWNAYALSCRTVVWLQQLAHRRDGLDRAWSAWVTEQVARQLRYLTTHLETDIGGNHLVKNIVALLWGAAAIESIEAEQWRSTGLKLLRRELGQVLLDGMHFERSPSYHAQVLGDLLTIRQALGGDPLGGSLDSAIRRAMQALIDLTHADGGPALFGDAGLTMAHAPDELRKAAEALTGKSFTPRASFDLPEGGYAGLRHEGDLFIVDAGPLGPDCLPGHAHGDIGSFEWSVSSERMIVDQGVFTYVSGEQRQASRRAANHNTLAAPDADQGEFFSSFRLGRRSRLARRVVEMSNGALHVEVGHDGLVGRNGGARHLRCIDAHRDEIVIEDMLDRRCPGASISFLVAPHVVVSQPEGEIMLTGDRATCRIATTGEATIEAAVWWPDMGVEIPTSRIRITLSGKSCRSTLSVLARKPHEAD